MSVVDPANSTSSHPSSDNECWQRQIRCDFAALFATLDAAPPCLRPTSDIALEIARRGSEVVLRYEPFPEIQADLDRLLDGLYPCLDNFNNPDVIAHDLTRSLDCLLTWAHRAVRFKASPAQRQRCRLALYHRARAFCDVDPDLNPFQLFRWLCDLIEAVNAPGPNRTSTALASMISTFAGSWPHDEDLPLTLTPDPFASDQSPDEQPRYGAVSIPYEIEIIHPSDLSVPLERCLRSTSRERARLDRLLARQRVAQGDDASDTQHLALLQAMIEDLRRGIAFADKANADIRRSRFHLV